MNSKLLTFFSNGDLAQHPQNTLTSFTNSFAEALYPQNKPFFKIRLRTIMISNQLAKKDVYANVIKIYVNESEPQTSNRAFETCLGSFDVSQGERYSNYTFFEFEHTPYIRIHKVPFDQISILITNGINQQLKLKPSYPTILIMELTEANVGSQFQITCYSHLLSPTAEILFPNNTLSNFIVTLPEEIELDSSWEVALTNISFPSQLHDSHLYIEVANQRMYFNSRDKKIHDVETMLTKIVQQFNGFYNSNEIICATVITDGVMHSLVFYRLNENDKKRKEEGKQIEAIVNLERKFSAIYRGTGEGEEEGDARPDDEDPVAGPSGVQQSPTGSRSRSGSISSADEADVSEEQAKENVKIRRKNQEAAFTADKVPIIISKTLMKMMGYRGLNDFRRDIKTGQYKWLSRRRNVDVDFYKVVRPTPLSMLYCDIVKPSIIAEVKGSLLQLIPMDDFIGQNANSNYTPKHLMFHSLIPYKIKNIKFYMTQTDGTENNFLSSGMVQDSVIITLLFRRKLRSIR